MALKTHEWPGQAEEPGRSENELAGVVGGSGAVKNACAGSSLRWAYVFRQQLVKGARVNHPNQEHNACPPALGARRAPVPETTII